jgi:1-deoxy-D-xylulose-5-phosphate synthase
MLDRGGLAGPDGPTHHGVFDVGYMRLFPNIISMAPADGPELTAMLNFALAQNSPTAIRYPKASAKDLGCSTQPIELGKGQIVSWGTDGAILALGPMVELAQTAAAQLAAHGLQVAVINPRFIKPLDLQLLERIFRECKFVLTVEEAALAGGFGSAVLEAGCDHGWEVSKMRRLGIPDNYIEHGERDELLAGLGISVESLTATCLELSANMTTVRG